MTEKITEKTDPDKLSEEELADCFTCKEDFPVQFLNVITNLAAQILGEDFGFRVFPYNNDEKEAVILSVGSIKHKEISVQVAFPTTEGAMSEARKAIVALTYKMYSMEQDTADKKKNSGLIVSDKKLIVP